MTPYLIGTIVAAAAAGAVWAIVGAGVSLFWRPNASCLRGLAARHRAHAIASVRLLPAASAAIAGTIVLMAFVRLEPADTREMLGVVLPASAFATLAVFGWRAASGYRAWARTRRRVAAWSAHPALVDSEFPIVAVVGIWQPRLYIARTVADACDRDEMNAIIAHEIAHVRAHDNLTRFCFLWTPFLLSDTARSLELEWMRAAEEAADDVARIDEQSSLALASALTKVARLATGQPMPALHGSAIFSGSGVEARIRRLLEVTPRPATALGAWRYAAALAAAIAALCSPAGLQQIYDAAEYCVRHLP